MTHKQFTEPIFDRLAEYRVQLIEHPLLAAGRAGKLSEELLREFAFHQYADSILWIPMLAQMRSKVRRSERLRQAIEDNIGHEAGFAGESHVTLAVNLLRSLGISELEAFPQKALAESLQYWIS